MNPSRLPVLPVAGSRLAFVAVWVTDNWEVPHETVHCSSYLCTRRSSL